MSRRSADGQERLRAATGTAALVPSSMSLAALTRLVIVEGVMGSGKSTLSRAATRQLRMAGRVARLHPESWTRRNPTDVGRETVATLAHRKDIWQAVSPDDLARRGEARWRQFVSTAQGTRTVNVFDGQLFNGDTTLLMLFDEPLPRLEDRSDRIMDIAAPLLPVLVYLRPSSVRDSLAAAVRARGEAWVQGQIGWKLESPYCRRLGLVGVDGWLELYERYQELTDWLVDRLSIPVLRLDPFPADWAGMETSIADFLGLEGRSSPVFRLMQWLRATYDDTFSHR